MIEHTSVWMHECVGTAEVWMVCVCGFGSTESISTVLGLITLCTRSSRKVQDEMGRPGRTKGNDE